MSEAKYYLGLSLCTVSEPNSNLFYRQTDALDGAGRRSFTQKGKGQKSPNFLNPSPWCFRFKVQFIGNFFKRRLQRCSGYESLHNIFKTSHPLVVSSTECAKNNPGSPNFI